MTSSLVSALEERSIHSIDHRAWILRERISRSVLLPRRAESSAWARMLSTLKRRHSKTFSTRVHAYQAGTKQSDGVSEKFNLASLVPSGPSKCRGPAKVVQTVLGPERRSM